MNIVITGTSRGIGLELCKQAKGNLILAVARQPQESAELEAVGVQTLAVDLRDAEAPAKIAAVVKNWGSLDLLINNAGVYKGDETAEDFLTTFHVNCVAPFLVTKALLPALQRSGAPKVVNITSKMGSITDNTSGGSYSYRASKAALNMINKTLAADNPWLTAIVVHPGWVQTDMGGMGAPVQLKDSATGIWSLIQKLKRADTGRFFDYRGESIPW
jgi:NAD(P)-dependent dehydrogenase (short-subunit alcohol dehydrogenase family)